MGQEHNHSHNANRKVLKFSLIIISTYMLVEVIGGLITNSLSLLADAGHMLSDAISILIALIAFKISSKVANYRKTYGYKRFEILAAIINGTTLILISFYIIYEAVDRFRNPPDVISSGMLIIAFIGLLINIFVAWIMMKGGDIKENLNMRGAYLHVISDMLGSFGAIIAALLIMAFDWKWADPLASIIVSILVLRSGYFITKSSIHILMEGTPTNVDMDNVIQTIQETNSIVSIHDLHIWTITNGLNALSCHVVIDGNITLQESEKILRDIEHKLEHLNIQHMTIQLESSNHNHNNSILCSIKATSLTHSHHH
ncbi:cation diffusion facilitator family transporter [Bergeyella porcorum]|uniref:cation diffusion facilitator family transporter n=1 Tax=Bergeyella porcorum TaxID=1735111 RepID=UPI0035E76EB9